MLGKVIGRYYTSTVQVVYSVYLAILARGRTAYTYTVTERFQAVKRLVSKGAC